MCVPKGSWRSALACGLLIGAVALGGHAEQPETEAELLRAFPDGGVACAAATPGRPELLVSIWGQGVVRLDCSDWRAAWLSLPRESDYRIYAIDTNPAGTCVMLDWAPALILLDLASLQAADSRLDMDGFAHGRWNDSDWREVARHFSASKILIYSQIRLREFDYVLLPRGRALSISCAVNGDGRLDAGHVWFIGGSTYCVHVHEGVSSCASKCLDQEPWAHTTFGRGRLASSRTTGDTVCARDGRFDVWRPWVERLHPPLVNSPYPDDLRVDGLVTALALDDDTEKLLVGTLDGRVLILDNLLELEDGTPTKKPIGFRELIRSTSPISHIGSTRTQGGKTMICSGGLLHLVQLSPEGEASVEKALAIRVDDRHQVDVSFSPGCLAPAAPQRD